MHPLFTIFIPHETNNFRPPILHHKTLFTIFILLLTVELNLSLFYSTDSKILGFATNVYQQKLIELTNYERSRQGLTLLRESSVLSEAAQLKASDMFSDNYWAHTAPDGTTPWVWFEKAGYNYLMAGENLAKDFDTSAGIVAGWMASPTHKDNLLNKDFSEIGIAVVNGKLLDEETTLVVQFFGTPTPRPEFAEGPMPLAEAPTVPQQPGSSQVASEEIYPERSEGPLPESVSAVYNQGERLLPIGIPAQALSKLDQLKFFASPAVHPSTWGIGQKLLVVVFAVLAGLFVADSVILWHEGIIRTSSHSLIHAGILGTLILGVIYSNFGLVL